MIAEVIDSNIERIRSDLETRGLTYDRLVEMVDDPVVAVQIKDHLYFTGDIWPYEYGVRDVKADPFMKSYYRLSDVAAGIALSEYISINYLLRQ